MDLESWPEPRADLVGDLWAVALRNLVAVRQHERAIRTRTELVGRTLQPWLGVLTVAQWLDKDCGVVGLFDRMHLLATSYQHERADVEANDPVRVVIQALDRMCDAAPELTFTAGELVKIMNQIAKDGDFAPEGRDFATPRSVGKVLSNLRVDSLPRGARQRRRRITRALINELATQHGVTMAEVDDALVA